MNNDVPRFGFGDNWNKFIRQKHNAQRLTAASERLTAFLGCKDLTGLDFLDIGCGSGLHSMAALTLGAGKIHSLDYDPDSVKATQFLREKAGNPPNWTVERGDVLDTAYMEALGKWNFVYSWGVLHHTGGMWDAIRNAQARVADDGLFYIALYSADVDLQPSKEFWLEIKKEYNRVTPFTRWLMMWWYVWRFGSSMNPRNIPSLVKQIWTYRSKRGMNYFTDVRDWIGGWPMEFAGDQETTNFLEEQFGFELINVSVGNACSEFLFRKTRLLGRKTDVKQLVEKLKAEKSYPVVWSTVKNSQPADLSA